MVNPKEAYTGKPKDSKHWHIYDAYSGKTGYKISFRVFVRFGMVWKC